MNLPTHSCRNRVFRQGIVKRCNRPTFWNHCDSCTQALEEQRARLLGISEAKKSPPNKPEELDVEDSFEVHDEDYEEKKEPGKKNNPRNDLDKGPKGEQGSKKSPYLKESFSSRPEISWPSKNPRQLRELKELRDRLSAIRLGDPEGGVDLAMDSGLNTALHHIEKVINELEGNVHDSESWASQRPM